MTETDIPPGGEGEIEVTFNTGAKTGKQKKTITVESNDPAMPKATLHISALIEIEFGFEAHSLNMGRIRKGESTSKTAVLLIKDHSRRSLVELGTQSSHVVAKTLGPSSSGEGRIDVEVIVSRETPPGRLNETITARLSDDSYPAASLRITGTVLGNVEVTPESVRFIVDTSRSVADQAEQRVKVASTQNEARLQLLSVEDSKNLLAIEIDTVVADEHYVIRAKPNENALELERSASGEVKILTDDVEQPEMRFRYSIIFPRR